MDEIDDRKNEIMGDGHSSFRKGSKGNNMYLVNEVILVSILVNEVY